MPKFSVKKPFVVLVGVVMLLVLGFVSFTKMTTRLYAEYEHAIYDRYHNVSWCFS